jgi:hypothetical protein
MTKEKTALVIPNAIQVWAESDKVVYTQILKIPLNEVCSVL